MSNVKSFFIAAEVPFNYLDSLPDEDVQIWARFFLTPAMGLKLRYQDAHRYEPSANGGQTAIYSLTIIGQEAISWPMVERMEHILKVHGSVQTFQVVDLEA